MLLAQAAEIGRAADAAIKSSADYGLIGVLFVLLLLGGGAALWMFAKFLARRDDLERVQRAKEDELSRVSRDKSEERFASELRTIRESFEKQLSEQRKSHESLLGSSNIAVKALSESIHELIESMLRNPDKSAPSESAIHRHRQSQRRGDRESVLEDGK